MACKIFIQRDLNKMLHDQAFDICIMERDMGRNTNKHDQRKRNHALCKSLVRSRAVLSSYGFNHLR